MLLHLPIASNSPRPEPVATFKSGELQSTVIDEFRLRSGVIIPAELSYRIYSHHPRPLEQPIVLVHSALTGSSLAFTDGTKTQGDGWANHLKGLSNFDFSKRTVVVVEPLGGNAEGISGQHLCSGRSFHRAGKLEDLHPSDTVEMTARVLKSHGISQISEIFCFSMGGSMIPGWIEQNEVRVQKIHSIFTNYQICPIAREYWQVQLDLLAIDGTPPNYPKLAEDLRNNFGLGRESCSTTFQGCVQDLANKIERLGEKGLSVESAEYANEALSLARQISFLRFQTVQNYNRREFGVIQSFLEKEGQQFLKRMDIVNYASMVKMMMAEFPGPEELGAFCNARHINVTYISDVADMLYPLNFDSAETRYVADRIYSIKTEGRNGVPKGHDGFLSECFPDIVRTYLR